MDLGLNGRTAIVTGASRGIGLAVTRGLVAEGVHVTAGARKSSAELGELAGTGMVRVVEADLSGPGDNANCRERKDRSMENRFHFITPYAAGRLRMLFILEGFERCTQPDWIRRRNV